MGEIRRSGNMGGGQNNPTEDLYLAPPCSRHTQMAQRDGCRKHKHALRQAENRKTGSRCHESDSCKHYRRREAKHFHISVRF